MLIHCLQQKHERYRWRLWGFWALCMVAGATAGVRLINTLNNEFKAPPYSPSAKSLRAIGRHFPVSRDLRPVMLLMWCSDPAATRPGCLRSPPGLPATNASQTLPILSAETRLFLERARAHAHQWFVGDGDHPGDDPRVVPRLLVDDYFENVRMTIPVQSARDRLVGRGGLTTWATVLFPSHDRFADEEFEESFAALVRENVPFAHSAATLSISGVVRELDRTAEGEMLHIDGLILPLSLGVLLWTLRRARLLLVPLFTIFMAFLQTMGCLYLLSWGIPVPMAAVTLVMTMTLALNIDYSLFLLCRLDEERQARGIGLDQLPEAMAASLATAGHTILVSGITLSSCFFTLLLVPNSYMRSIGAGCALVTVNSVVAYLFWVPLLFSTFPRMLLGDSVVDKSRSSPTSSRSSSGRHLPAPRRLTTWGRLAALVSGSTRAALLAIAAVLLLTVPVCSFALDFRISTSLFDFVPPEGATAEAAHRLQETFGPGALADYRLMLRLPSRVDYSQDGRHLPLVRGPNLSPPHADEAQADGEDPRQKYVAVLSEHFFQNAHQALALLAAAGLPGLSAQALSRAAHSVFFSRGHNISYHEAVFCEGDLGEPGAGSVVEALLQSSPWLIGIHQSSRQARAHYHPCADFRRMRAIGVDRSGTAAILELRLDLDPSSGGGHEFLSRLRALEPRIREETGIVLAVSGGDATFVDLVEGVYSHLPIVIAADCVVVVATLGFTFRSAVLPVKVILTIALTLSWVYGMGSLVYIHGWLDWLGVRALHSRVDGINWVVPVAAVSTVTGLSLDYAIFLLDRITELRFEDGLSAGQAIIRGVDSTANLISMAGVIMALTFGGLLFSQLSLLNQVGFYLSLAILLDTFLVRTVLVPTLMALMADNNWWPRKPPPFSGGDHADQTLKEGCNELP
jgi:hypothetical protein